MNNIKKEILEGNYWEHFKLAKDLALILDINHSKRIKIDNAINQIRIELEKLK